MTLDTTSLVNHEVEYFGSVQPGSYVRTKQNVDLVRRTEGINYYGVERLYVASLIEWRAQISHSFLVVLPLRVCLLIARPRFFPRRAS